VKRGTGKSLTQSTVNVGRFPQIICMHLLFNVGSTRVEAGYNTSAVALRIVRGDKKGTQFPGV
jgi:hypothetical protein